MNKKNILYIAAAFAGLILFWNFALSPGIERYKLLNRKIESSIGFLNRYRGIMNRKDEIERLYLKYIDFFKMKSSETEEKNRFSKEIEKISSEANLNISNIVPFAAEGTESYYLYSIEVIAQGEMKEFVDFIHRLQNLSPPVKVIRLRIQVDKKSGLLKAQIKTKKILLRESS